MGLVETRLAIIPGGGMRMIISSLIFYMIYFLKLNLSVIEYYA